MVTSSLWFSLSWLYLANTVLSAFKILRSLEADVSFDSLDGVLPEGTQLFRFLRPLFMKYLVPLIGKPGIGMSYNAYWSHCIFLCCSLKENFVVRERW